MKKFIFITVYLAVFLLTALNCEEAGKKEQAQDEQTQEQTQPADTQNEMSEATQAGETAEPAEEAVEGKTEGEDVAEAPKTAPEPQSGTFKGYIASLKHIAAGGDGKVDKAAAQKLAKDGQPLVFVTGGKAYFIVMKNGSVDASDIAKFASAKTVGVNGSKKSNMGVNFILASMVRPM